MGWFKRLLQRKPGGSLFGNLLRKVGDYATGGLYSQFNPIMDCPRVAPPGSGIIPLGFGSNSSGGFFGCDGAGFAFRGGFIEDILPIFTPPSTGTGIAPVYTPTNDTINSNTTNVFGMNIPTNVGNALESIVNMLDNNIELDLNDIPSSLINTVDNFFGDEIPPVLENLLGVNSQAEIVDPVAASSWSGHINIGGVEVSASGGNSQETQTPTTPTDTRKWHEKLDDWLQSTISLSLKTTGIVLGSVVAVSLTAWYFLKPKNKRRR
ncbi:hypothetical protein [Corallibacter sp.]|uniref:hypothetical protein n=1 Tax=Corallibacter sp. TaxID=2038084 RepID=UPI003A8C9A48